MKGLWSLRMMKKGKRAVVGGVGIKGGRRRRLGIGRRRRRGKVNG